MELQQFLGTKSLRAFRRLYKPRFQRKRAKLMKQFYMYKPRGDLIKRLADKTGLSESTVLSKLQKERIEYLRLYYPDVKFNEWEVI